MNALLERFPIGNAKHCRLPRRFRQDVRSEDAAEESEEMRLPGNILFAREHAEHHPTIEEAKDDGDRNPSGAFLQKSFHQEKAEIAKDDSTGSEMDRFLASKEPHGHARDENDDHGGGEKSAHACESKDEAESQQRQGVA